MKNNLQNTITKWIAPACITALALLTTTLSAQAQPPRHFPYQGYLEIDGEPVGENQRMRFYINNAERAGRQLWAEEHDSVSLNQGKFNVVLGIEMPFDDNLFQSNEALYLGVQVHHSGLWRDMGTRQRLLPVPYAIHAKEAEHAALATTAQQAENFDISGTLTVPTVQGQMVVSGGEAAGANSTDSALKIVGGGGTLIFDGNEIESSGILNLQPTARQKTRAWGDLEVDGDLEVAGNLSVTGTLITASIEYSAVAWGGSSDERDARGNPNNQNIRVMIDSARSVCFLTRTFVDDVEGGQEGVCEIYKETNANSNNFNKWMLKARAGNDENGANVCGAACRTDTQCKARCISW